MRWPWSKRTVAKASHLDDAHEGERAREEATANLAATNAQWPEVHRVAQSLRELRERNHFATQLEHIFRGDSDER